MTNDKFIVDGEDLIITIPDPPRPNLVGTQAQQLRSIQDTLGMDPQSALAYLEALHGKDPDDVIVESPDEDQPQRAR